MKDKLKYDKYVDNKNYYQIKVNRIASVRLIIFMMMLISFIAKYYYYPRIFSFVFISCLVIFLLLVFIHDYYFKKFDYYVKCVEVINRYLARENGEWKHFKDKGDDFLKDAPYYYSDLDIFGNNSLFQYLSICRTLGGRRLLKDRLSNIQFSSNKLALEQDAVKEISEHTSFLVDLECLLLSFEDKNVDLSKDYSLSFDKVDYVNLFISIIFSVFSILFFCLGIFGVISIHYFYGIFLFNYMISTLFSSIYKNDFSCLEKMIISYRGVDSIIQRTLNEDFSSKKLKNIQNNFKNSLASRDSLKRLDTIYSFRSNFISNFILNGFCCINFIFIFLFQCFKKKDLSQYKNGYA